MAFPQAAPHFFWRGRSGCGASLALDLRWIDVPVLPIYGRRDARMMFPLFYQRQRPAYSGANSCVSREMLCTCCAHASLVNSVMSLVHVKFQVRRAGESWPNPSPSHIF